MLKNPRDRKAALAVGKALFALAAIVAFFTLPLPHIDLPSLPHPEAPDLPDWLATTLRWGKFAILACIAVLLVAGAIEDRRGDDTERPGEKT